jgi:hypothetical protein
LLIIAYCNAQHTTQRQKNLAAANRSDRAACPQVAGARVISIAFANTRQNWSRSRRDVIVATAGCIVGILQQASRSVPIVFVTTIDPVGSGFVASLARPGGNATGFTLASRSLAVERNGRSGNPLYPARGRIARKPWRRELHRQCRSRSLTSSRFRQIPGQRKQRRVPASNDGECCRFRFHQPFGCRRRMARNDDVACTMPRVEVVVARTKPACISGRNPNAPAVKREAEDDWGLHRR